MEVRYLEEIWKSVYGYEGYYIINNYGIVKSVERYITKADGVIQHRKQRIMKQSKNDDGYLTVKLSKDGVSKRLFVHKLVALAFVDGYFDGAEVNHIDCNRQNNEYTNLEWCSHKENVDYCFKLGRHVSQTRNYNGCNNPNYHNTTLKKIYAMNPKLAKEKQSRPGAINGRAKKIRLQLNNRTIIDFDYIGECALYLINNGYTKTKSVNAIRTAITESIKQQRKYLGLNLSFI